MNCIRHWRLPVNCLNKGCSQWPRTIDFRLWKGIAKANKRTTKQEQAVGRREAQQHCHGLERLKVLTHVEVADIMYVEALHRLESFDNQKTAPQLDRQKWKLLTLYVEALNRMEVQSVGMLCCVNYPPNAVAFGWTFLYTIRVLVCGRRS
uniref:Uncharacterized protein n=1 Tax=Globodera rostochiensis TaxID=31243 RepID=A0A914H2Z1_GLORO